LKVYRGQIAGLKDNSLMARKAKDESALRKSIAANPERQKKYGDAWDEIAKAHANYPNYIKDRRIFEQASGFNTTLFTIARNLVRLADENAKPNAERLPEFTDARRASLELGLYSPAPIYRDFEKLKLTDSLEFMVELLGADNALAKQVLAGKSPEARATELIDGTKLADVDYRKELAKGGRDAIASSTDPMIQLARLVDAKAREARKRYESELTGVERTNYGKIARALFETEGTKLYPDATFTLRLSYGAVEGYMEKGKKVEPFTTLGGLYARADSFKQEFPYNLPPRWVEKKSALDLKTPFNFVTTNDIIGGNSGSPSINQNGELVGLIFDGNIQSLVGDFIYDPSVNRAISVDSRGMLEILKKVFGANDIVAELTAS
jgi:Peptidase S46